MLNLISVGFVSLQNFKKVLTLLQVADFGLAREVTDAEYILSSNTKLPARWMAVESMTNSTYTCKSDV